MSRRAVIVGAGLSGATANYELLTRGWHVEAYDQSRFGGLSRNSWMDGVLYEPHGSHIFHTDDDEVWELASSLTPFWRYEHSVITMVRGRKMTWPIQREEVIDLYGYEAIAHHDAISESMDPSTAESFEDYCLSIMAPVIYDDFIAPYTEKQWGVDASELSASFAPKRVQVRDDGDKRLFKDRHQGFPDSREGGSYDQMHRGLWGRTLHYGHVHEGARVWLELLEQLVNQDRADLVVVTVPLDDLCGGRLGELAWRGLRFEHKFVNAEFVQDAMVVNWPAKDWPFIRTHETKHASRQECFKTIVTTEFPGGPGRYYPVPGRDSRMGELNEQYQELIRSVIEPLGARVAFCGRLATYRYLDQDDAMRDSLDAVRDALDS